MSVNETYCIALPALLDLEKKAVVSLTSAPVYPESDTWMLSCRRQKRSSRAAAQFPGSRYRSEDDA